MSPDSKPVSPVNSAPGEKARYRALLIGSVEPSLGKQVLYDPRRAHTMHNDLMDELDFAAGCGFDAVCLNEHLLRWIEPRKAYDRNPYEKHSRKLLDHHE